jgi:hypothetical protein
MAISEALGYTGSSHFYAPERVDALPASELSFALRLASLECAKIGEGTSPVHFEGAYVLQREPSSPAVPVVYVVRVESEKVARQVHQFVWNQNQAPFLIVESPSTIRLYPGFAFNRQGDKPLVSPPAAEIADVLEKLAAFRSESIDDGTIWREWAHAVKPLERVDESLLRDLMALDATLQKEGLDRGTSHGLIGKFVYLRYLKDRQILSPKKLDKWGIDPEHVFSRQATLKAFRQVNAELQTWLNGSVFTLGEADLGDISQAQLRLVAGVFQGDAPAGDAVQRALFDVYDFSHIPIETLSCVYEQFLHDAKGVDGESRGKTLGAYYTPLPLADYVLSEMDRRRPLRPGMKVLDPACGSGAFLVQCYRRLIEQQRRAARRDLKKTELRDLLKKHIFGIDRDDDACRVAELSLIMTLLNYVQPPDLEDTAFKLPALRDSNIFQGVFFDASGPVHALLEGERFDWIVGNPPWAEVKKTPSKDHEHFVVHQWMKSHKKTHPTSGNQIAEAFLWKSGEHLAADGACGLVVPAMTWFKKEAKAFRQRFFSERRVWCLANFANLAYVLFAGRSERPASVVFFDSGLADGDHVIQSFSPFVAEQVANRPEKANRKLVTWNIVVSGKDVHEIEQPEAVAGESLTWKLAMWGTPRDRKLLQKLEHRFQDASFEALKSLGIETLSQGLELRPSSASNSEPIVPHPELRGRSKLLFDKLRNIGRIFAFPRTSIGEIGEDECYVRQGRDVLPIAVSSPPHVIIDASRRFAVYSDDFIAIPPRQIGIAGSEQSSTHLRALSLYLSSDFARYHQFFYSPKWGIDESIADLNTLKLLPMPVGRLSAAELKDWAALQRELSGTASSSTVGEWPIESLNRIESLQIDLNARVFKLLGLRRTERWLVEDFVRHHLELNKGKVTQDVLRAPTVAESQEYLLALRDSLDGFLSKERGMRHRIRVLTGPDSALLSISLARSDTAVEPVRLEADDSGAKSLVRIGHSLQTQQSQWVYFDRALKVYQQGVLYQFKPLQRLHWTRRQAVLDADEIIAETLAEGGES